MSKKTLSSILSLVMILSLFIAPARAAGLIQEDPPPNDRTAPYTKVPHFGPDNIGAATVNYITPTTLDPGSSADLCFNITIPLNDAEYLDRFDFNLPDAWIVNSVTDVMETGCGDGSGYGNHTYGVEAGNIVHWTTNGYPPQTFCGAWEDGYTYNFCANITIPDCTSTPWSIPWNIIGDAYGDPPHSVSGEATTSCALASEPDIEITPLSLNAQLCPNSTETQPLQICNAGALPLDWTLSELPGAGMDSGSLWDSGVLVRSFADHSGSTPVSAESNGANLYTVSGGDVAGNRFARYLPDGTFDTSYAPGIDFRSIDTNNAGELFARGYPQHFYAISPAGVPTNLFTLTGADAQASAVFNAEDTELYVRYNSTVSRHDALTGAFLGQFTLNGLAGNEIAYPANIQFDTDRSGRMFTYADGVVSEWDTAGNRIGTTTIPIATPSDFGTTFSFAVDGDGYVYLVNALTLNWEVYDIGVDAPEIPWLSETPVTGSLPAGTCSTIDVTFDSTGLTPAEYLGSLYITSNDPDEPLVTIPVTMTVLAPVSGADFSWAPLDPQVAQTVSFTATVAAGEPPIDYAWDFGDGSTATGSNVQYSFLANGTFTVTLTASNLCGLSTVQHPITVTGDPDIAVSPLSLSADLCPNSTETQPLQICNEGNIPLDWELSEIPVSGTLGLAPIPDLISATAWTNDGAAFQRSGPSHHIQANQVLIIEDDLPWYRWSTPNILTANGITYDMAGSANMAAIDLSPYVLVIIGSAQSNAFYTAWNTNFAKFESYVSSGGYLWMGTATSTAGLTNPLLPGGVVVNDDVYAQYGNVAAPGHPWVAGVISPFEGLWVSHGEFTNLYPGSIVVATSATTGNPTLVDYSFGLGRVLITSLSLEIGWDYGWSEAPILQNSLLDMFVPEADIPWLSEAPTASTLPAGECATVDVTFDSTGLTPAEYLGSLLITSSDPDEPEITIPVTLTVDAPADILDVTFVSTDLQVDFDSTVTGTLPLTYAWDFGDGGTSSLEDPSYTYGSGGTFFPMLTASNICGSDLWSGSVTVCEPVYNADFTYWPLSPALGELVTFAASAMGTEPIFYTWDFGDGATGAGSFIDHAYAAPGSYTVTLTATNDCGQEIVQKTVTVVVPDIDVTPLSLDQELCPDLTATQPLTICNTGLAPLDWSMYEMTPTLAAGVQAVLWEQSWDMPGGTYSNRYNVPSYGIYTADDFINLDPWYIESIFVPGNYYGPSILLAESLNWCIYPDLDGEPGGEPEVGGEYWCWSGAPTDPAITLGGQTGSEITLDVTAAQGAPLNLPAGLWWLTFYPQFENENGGTFYWGSSETDNLAYSQFIDPTNHWGIGYTDWTEWWNMDGSPARSFTLSGQIAYPDIPWISENVIDGSLLPGECTVVDVTFDSTGLTPGDYFADLHIVSNDPDEPEIIVPTSLHVTEPAAIQDVTYTASDLQVDFDLTASGEPPLVYAWDFGDGVTSALEDPTHTYAAGGCYTVNLAVSNGCAIVTWSEEICVCDPVTEADFSWSPLDPEIDESIAFTATAAGGDPPFTFAWDWGDGTTGSGQYASHAYSTPGQYAVLLTVTNDCGLVTVEHTVVVAGIPDISVDPLLITAQMLPNHTATATFTITNNGSAELTFNLAEGETWLDFQPISGALAPGASQVITATFDSTGLSPFTYTAEFWVFSNDPDQASIRAEAVLTVLQYYCFLPFFQPGFYEVEP